jgi:NAD(P)H dehydrogenase (quinone)
MGNNDHGIGIQVKAGGDHMAVKVAIIYYSATGNTFKLAQAVEAGARAEGAEVRLRRVAELTPLQIVNSKPDWKRHLEETQHIPEPSYDDLTWADAYVLGTPTRFGTISAQLKEFIDTTGPLWAQGKLANKAAAVFTTAQNIHGGQEATLLNMLTVLYHWGCIIVPPAFDDPVVFAAGANPYGVSATVPEGPDEQLDQAALDSARYLGRRVAYVAGWISAGRSIAVPV